MKLWTILFGATLTAISGSCLYYIVKLAYDGWQQRDVWIALGGGFLILSLGSLLASGVIVGLLFIHEGLTKRRNWF